jgi:hypothetical protein
MGSCAVMAGAISSNVALSDLLSKSHGNAEENTCRRCHDSETQLKEALSELSSAQTIISFLQNELILAKASMSMGAENQSHSEPDTGVWKLVAYNNNNNKVKSEKRDKPYWSELASFNHPASTTNRFSLLFNLLSGEHVFTQKIHKTTGTYSKANKIPTIIAGISVPYSELSSATLK